MGNPSLSIKAYSSLSNKILYLWQEFFKTFQKR